MTELKKLPATRSNTLIEPTSPLGIELRKARLHKQIAQIEIGVALAAKCGGESSNVRVSQFELSRKLPSDAELTVLAQVLGLSVVSLRELREASRVHTKTVLRQLYEHQIATGVKTRSFTLKPKQVPIPIAKPAKPVKAAKPVPAEAPALADLVEQIDEIAPMPSDKEARRRWFSCVSVLHRLGAAS